MFSRTPLDDPRIAAGMNTQFKLRAERLAKGETPIGWKAGFGAPTPLTKLKLEAALTGFMTDGTKIASGSSISLAGWSKQGRVSSQSRTARGIRTST